MSQTLPITAYVKMIDVWLILSMMYPFCVVTLYSLLEAVTPDDEVPVPLTDDKKEQGEKTVARIISFMLDYGLPFTFTLFSIVFLALGIGTANIAAYK